MVRLLIGLIKGVVVGGAIGFGAYSLGMSGGFNWLTYGLVGAMVGLLVGRPIWSHLLDKSSTVWTPILKAIFGYGVGIGLYALVAKAWGGFNLTIADETHNLYDWQYILGGAIGAVYGAWIELDDSVDAQEKQQKKKG